VFLFGRSLQLALKARAYPNKAPNSTGSLGTPLALEASAIKIQKYFPEKNALAYYGVAKSLLQAHLEREREL
jgi:hypothetical protein